MAQSAVAEKDLRKLSRSDLLEMLLEQTEKVEFLSAENEKLSSQLQECREKLDQVESLRAREAYLESLISKIESALNTSQARERAALKSLPEAKPETQVKEDDLLSQITIPFKLPKAFHAKDRQQLQEETKDNAHRGKHKKKLEGKK